MPMHSFSRCKRECSKYVSMKFGIPIFYTLYAYAYSNIQYTLLNISIMTVTFLTIGFQEWDLWGPLILCTFMATILQGHDTNSRDASDSLMQIGFLVNPFKRCYSSMGERSLLSYYIVQYIQYNFDLVIYLRSSQVCPLTESLLQHIRTSD